MRYAVIDIETTGHPDNRITDISVFVSNGREVIEEFHSLVNPVVPIPYNIIQLTGIDDAMVRHAPKFEEIASRLEEITRDSIFVAHNVSFDFGHIAKQFNELGFTYDRKKLCTVRMAKKHIKGHKSYSLGTLCEALGIQINGRHRAKGDAEATVVLLHKILQQTAGLFA